MAVASEADEFTWDIDGDGKETPLTDGLLIIRYLFGFTDQALVQGAVDSSATRSTAADIKLISTLILLNSMSTAMLKTRRYPMAF